MERIFYLTIGQIQDVLDAYYQKNGKCLSVPEAMEYLKNHTDLCDHADNSLIMERMYHQDQLVFLRKIRDISIEISRKYIRDLHTDISYFPREQVDVFVQNSFRNTKTELHAHTNFEVIYIYYGEYDFQFEEEIQVLHEGAVIILSKGALHRLKERTADSFYMSFFINYDTLSVAFLSILSENNILSQYFRKMLTNQKLHNYLLISTNNTEAQYYLAQNLFLEQHRYDEYSPQSSLCWLKLFFTNVLRRNTGFRQYARSDSGITPEFASILNYIDRHYRTVSLAEIARLYNYSESHLSSVIQKVTGKKFSDLIKTKKLSEACDYLTSTTLPVKEIADLCGYNDADHFSKTFRREFGMTPKEYRFRH